MFVYYPKRIEYGQNNIGSSRDQCQTDHDLWKASNFLNLFCLHQKFAGKYHLSNLNKNAEDESSRVHYLNMVLLLLMHAVSHIF